jgi:hypothetical protein
MSPVHDRDLDAAARDRHGGREFSRAREGAAPTDMEARLGLEARPSPGAPPTAWAAVTSTGRHGGHPGVHGAVARMQTGAGNAAVAGLLVGRTVEAGAADARATRRVGPTMRHAGDADVPGNETSAPVPLGTEDPANDATALEDEGGGPVLPPPTSSSTTVGPPTSSNYTVSGTLRQAAEAVAARPEAGLTLTSPVLNMAPPPKWPTHVQVIVGQAVQLPEWDGKASATQNQRNEWDRFKAAITAHEAGHVSTDVKAYANAHVKIKAKPTRAEGEAEFETISTQADTDNDAFDARTDHGRNQGTNINPNIDEVTKVP